MRSYAADDDHSEEETGNDASDAVQDNHRDFVGVRGISTFGGGGIVCRPKNLASDRVTIAFTNVAVVLQELHTVCNSLGGIQISGD